MKVLALLSLIALSTANIEFTYADHSDDSQFTKAPASKFLGKVKVVPIEAVSGFGETFMGVVNNWGNITNALKSSTSNVITQALTCQGFSKFQGKGSVNIDQGLKPEKLDTFLSFTSKRWNITASDNLTPEEIVEEKLLSEENYFVEFDVSSSGSDGELKFNTMHVSQSNDKYNFIRTTMRVSFSLAPNINVIEKKKSILGGMFESAGFVREEIPNNVKISDFDAVRQFMAAFAYKTIGKEIGFDLPMPVTCK
jgi:hypothetical protein